MAFLMSGEPKIWGEGEKEEGGGQLQRVLYMQGRMKGNTVTMLLPITFNRSPLPNFNVQCPTHLRRDARKDAVHGPGLRRKLLELLLLVHAAGK